MIRTLSGLFFAGTFVLTLTCFATLGPGNSQGRETWNPGCESISETGGYRCADFIFERVKKENSWHLSYQFRRNSKSDWVNVRCEIDEAASRKLENAYGYRLEDWKSEKRKYFEASIIKEAENSGKLKYGRVQVDTSCIPRWMPKGVDHVPGKDLELEEKAFVDWYNPIRNSLLKKAEENFQKDHGFFRIQASDFSPDYPSVAGKSFGILRNCVDELRSASHDDEELLRVFFQAMWFEFVELEDRKTGKRTGGLRLPSALMISASGDCDSKATAFCMVADAGGAPLLIFRSLNGEKKLKHALVGIPAFPDAKPVQSKAQARSSKAFWVDLEEGQYERPVLVGFRYYWPVEVSGPARMVLGQVATGHGGSYWPIEMPIPPAGGKRP